MGIDRWCNGNTTDSGPVIQGSSPCRSTKEKHRISDAFFVVYFLLPIGSAAKPLFSVYPQALWGRLQCVAAQSLYSPNN